MCAFKHKSILGYEHEIIQVYEQFNFQVHISLTAQSPQHSSIILIVFERTNVQLHNHLSLQAYRHIIIQVWIYVYEYQTSKYQCMWAWEHHQSMLACEHRIIKAWEHVIINARENESTWSSRHVGIGVCDHPSMWAGKH